jgi:tetratricopeptide (TPR) repeat protein
LFLLSWAGLGWIGPPLLITLLLWKYIGLQERVVTCLLWILSAAIPYALYFPALEINYEAGILPVLEDPLNGTLLQERGTKLGEWLKKNSKDAEALFSLGLIQKKLGKTELARSNFEEAAKAKPGWAKPSVNLANLDYQEGKIDSAISRLQAVISTSPSFLAYYDAAKIFYKQSRLDEGLQANKKAKGLDAGRFADLEQITVNQNDAKKFLIDEKLDPKDLSPRIWEITPQIEVIRTRLHRTYLPALPLPYYWIVIVLNLILSIGMSQLFPVRRVPRPCEKCGLPSCVLCEPMIEHESLCSQCFHMYVRLEAIDLSARRSKENSIRLYRFLREFRERWIGFFLPGMQYLFTDRALAWFFYSLFFLPAVVLILFESFWIESPFTVSNLPHFPYHWIGISLGLFFYLITLTSILRKT